MKTLICAVLLSLPLFAQVPTTFTFVADEAAADPIVGTIPLGATVTNITDGTLQGIEITLFSNFPHVAELVIEDSSWTCATTGLLKCTDNSPLLPHASAVLDFKVRFPNKAGRAQISAHASYQTSGGPVLRRQCGRVDDDVASLSR